ncbi:MAG: hypothetical protein PHW64_06220 [Sulfuricurvum sp.]|nr:hypothetical protein [Sulfuricurvum sp.]
MDNKDGQIGWIGKKRYINEIASFGPKETNNIEESIFIGVFRVGLNGKKGD